MSIKEIEINVEDEKIATRLLYAPFNLEDLKKLVVRNGSSVISTYLPLSIVKQSGETKIVVGDARDHKEFDQAIEKDLGKVDWLKDAQVYLNSDGVVDQINIHANGRNYMENEKEILSLFSAFNRECLRPEVLVRYYDPSYYYFSTSGEVSRTGFR